MPAGRPSDYTKDLAEKICVRLIDGESLREICTDDDMPDKATVLRWLVKHDEFRAQYTQARELQADGDMDDVVEISDDSATDWEVKVDRRTGESEKVFAHDHVQRAKLRIETRFKRAEKMHPKKYGPLVKQEVSGPDGKAVPISLTIDWAAPIEAPPA